MIAFFVVFREIESGEFDFLGDAQSDHSFHDERDNRRGDDRENQRDCNRFELVHQQAVFQPGDNAIRFFARKNSGEKRTQSSTNAVDAERVQRVVITESCSSDTTPRNTAQRRRECQ